MVSPFVNFRKFFLLLFIILAGFYVWTRLYKIDQSLLFFNDIGRDFWVLWRWFESGKPPLLGPQTSALPFNQSAVYFYLLSPLFLLTNQSFFSTIYTVTIFYLVVFYFCIKLFAKTTHVKITILLTGLLLTIHPQQIVQNRFIWNPSFVAPLIVFGYFAWQNLLKNWSKLNLWLFSLALSLATCLSYSVAPVFLAFMLTSAWYFKNNYRWLKIYLASGVSLLFWQLPTIVFELRHHFLLTKLLIYGEKLAQPTADFSSKLRGLSTNLFSGLNDSNFIIILIIGVAVGLIFYRQKNYKLKLKHLSPVFALLITSLVITLIAPIGIQSHYIFGLLSLGILLIAQIDLRFSWPVLLVLTIGWLIPIVRGDYFMPAYRSVKESNQCAKQICQNFTEPVFVSVQSGIHPYHDGMEWKYLLARNGCQVKELSTEISQANKMVVIVDQSSYTHGQTAYNELTQFGSSSQTTSFFCQDNLEARLLTRN